jgi:hypothetical protein
MYQNEQSTVCIWTSRQKMENGQFDNQQREEIDEAKTNDETSYEIVLAKC